MNKKVKKPEFLFPFKNKEHEEENKHYVVSRLNTISDRNSKIELTETVFKGGYRKLELKETIYFKKGEDKKLSERLYLRPYDQVRLEKFLDFVLHIQKDGNAFLTRKDSSKDPIKFTSNQQKIIKLFYERKDVTLKDAIDILGTYKTTESLRQTIHKMNGKIIGMFKLAKTDEFINGTIDKKRSGYSFNPNIRLEFIDDRVISD
ncbi:MAG: hypothetical protein A2017_05440 [Lentisphaerae bacterium GWF2_44_16]|nr:MAG: hypothetical protein A2017_05440 [Lentisphaerae bacterium GWF2_44_16]